MEDRSAGDVVLIFDGDCGFCTRSVGWLRRLDRRGRVAFVPAQGPGVPGRHGLSAQDVADAAWTIDEAGVRHRGAGAVNAALAAALGSRVPLIAYRLPGVRQLQDLLYAVVARNRGRLPGVTPWCQSHPDECADGP